MLNDTLTKLETTIRQSDTIQADKKAELLQLLTTLQAELAVLAHTDAAHAERVIIFTERSLQEVIQQTRDPAQVASAAAGLSATVAELEASHPQLVHIVNAISVLLASIGI